MSCLLMGGVRLLYFLLSAIYQNAKSSLHKTADLLFLHWLKHTYTKKIHAITKADSLKIVAQMKTDIQETS